MTTILSDTRRPIPALPAAILLTFLALLVYANTFNAPFLFDDLPNITQNPDLRVTRPTLEALARALKTRSATRPLAFISFAINHCLHGYDVRGYHAVNLSIHFLTALMLFLAARLTLRLTGAESGYIPFLAAALWLVNPVHTQSVTYIVQRMNSLAALFFMLALYCYIRARMAAPAGSARARTILLYALCLIAALLGLASKEIVITLPAVLFLYEWYFFQGLDRAWLKKRLPWLILAVATGVIIAVIKMDGSPLRTIAATYAEQKFTPGQRLLTQPGVVIYYISLMLFPHPSRLNVDYDFPLSTPTTHPALIILPMAAMAALLAAALYRPGRHRLASFAVLWFLGNLAIESSIIGLAIIFEHRTYLPSLVPFLAATALLIRRLPRPAALISLGLMIAVSGIWTFQRNAAWKDPLTFWQDCARKSPRNPRPANGIGMAFQALRQPEKALEWFQETVRLDPAYDEAYSNIGGILIHLGRPDDAVPWLERAIALDPENFEAFNNLGTAMHRLNRLDEAVAYYRKSLSLYPDYETAHNNLGGVLTERGDIDGAVRHLNRAILINPEYAVPYNNLGLAMMQRGRIEEAIDLYQHALRLDPEYPNAHFNLGTAWFQKGELDPARRHLEQAARFDPQPVLALNNLATVLVMQKKYAEAVDTLTRLSGLLPESPTVYYNLACAYALQGKKEEAVAFLQKAVGLGYDRWENMKTDPDLKNLHDTDYFKNLVMKQS